MQAQMKDENCLLRMVLRSTYMNVRHIRDRTQELIIIVIIVIKVKNTKARNSHVEIKAT